MSPHSTRSTYFSCLVVGADGQVGSVAATELTARGCRVTGTTRREEHVGPDRLFLDLTRPPHEWPELPSCDAVAICTAITSIAECEADPDGTAVVNFHAPVELARRLCERGTFVLFLSSTGVFDFQKPFRRHDEPPCPVTNYGRQKAEAEDKILVLDGKTAVLRLTKVMGPEMLLLNSWCGDLASGREITAYEDTFIAPITAAFVARMIYEVVSNEAESVFHASGDEDVPYTVLAEQLVRAMGADGSLVKTVEGGLPHYPTANAPRYTTLDMSRESDLFGLSAPSSLATMKETVAFLASNGLSLPTQVPSVA